MRRARHACKKQFAFSKVKKRFVRSIIIAWGATPSCSRVEAGGSLRLAARHIFALGALLLGLPLTAKAQGVRVGVLSCKVEPGWGMVILSEREMRCTFTPAAGANIEYAGTIRKWGIDVGYRGAGAVIWAVLAPSATIAPGDLAGDYVGATLGGALGLGAGANFLVGGSNRSISLQPLSIEGNTGFNLAAGIASIALRYEEKKETEAPAKEE
jgi:hypothetical protein